MSTMKTVVVTVKDHSLPEVGIDISIADTVGNYNFNDFADFIIKSPFGKNITNIICFHKTKDVKLANSVIATEPELFTAPNYDRSDDLLEQIYEEKKHKTRSLLIKQREETLKHNVVYSNSAILAFAHSVVNTYPELIPYIDNSVYVERAYKFMHGSYLYKLERAMNPPVVKVHHGDDDDVIDFNSSLEHWIKDCYQTTLILLAQYGATGDEKYLTIMDTWPLYSRVKIHRAIVGLASELEADLGPYKLGAEDIIKKAIKKYLSQFEDYSIVSKCSLLHGTNHARLNWIKSKIPCELLKGL